ncbi:hypothetical protein [Kitasatospora cheerisanensis]|uniref:Uncharacterized protein n=1 Tax=Kitasatospora cheerisanensis KCTC 2395 TaxID=1348663 RepID=A0A066YVX2_9ACTN|nr:hypothetical protein [Kitasatospora cheerisanensis]KDN82090.1 hypothetical protein KCH_62440 [Kitasatospora cheerisanensis KCTC 2395]
MTSEEDFTRALRDSADFAPAPPTELFALAAERRGRTRVRRRRTLGASAVALVAATGCALALLPGHTPAPVRTTPAAPVVDGVFMSTTLRSLLPADGRVTDPAGTEVSLVTPGQAPMAWLDYDDGHGSARVLLAVDRLATPLSDGTPALQCPDTLAEPTTTCRRTTRPDGSRLTTSTKAPRWDGDDRAWSVTYAAPDGRAVTVHQVTSATPGHPARETPPLTEAQLQDVAASDAWRPAYAVLPAATVPPAAPVAGRPSSPRCAPPCPPASPSTRAPRPRTPPAACTEP